MRLYILSALIAITLVLVSYSKGQDCSNRGSLLYERCSCFSGYWGNNCEKNVTLCEKYTRETVPVQPDLDVIDTTQAGDYEFLAYLAFIKDRLNYNATLTANNVLLNETACSFPNPHTNLVKALEGVDGNCVNRTGVYVEKLKFDVPWMFISHCFAHNNTDPSYDYYDGEYNLYIKDYLGYSNGQHWHRDSEVKLPLKFIFLRSITISSILNVTVINGEVDIGAFVTLQTFNLQTRILTLELTAEINYPYTLAFNSFVNLPFAGYHYPDKTVQLVSQINKTDSTTQVWRFTSKFLTEACDVNEVCTSTCSLAGIYKLKFDVNCRDAGFTCPSNVYAEVTDYVESENLCLTSTFLTTFTPSISSFDSNTFTIPKNSFIDNEVAYFKLDLTSSRVSIAKTSLVDVTFKNSQGQKVSAKFNRVTQTIGTNSEYTEYPLSESSIGYSLKLGLIREALGLTDIRNEISSDITVEVEYRDRSTPVAMSQRVTFTKVMSNNDNNNNGRKSYGPVSYSFIIAKQALSSGTQVTISSLSLVLLLLHFVLYVL